MGGDQTDVLHGAELATHGLHPEHVEHLGDGHALGLDELAAPEGIADLGGILAVLLAVGLERLLGQLDAAAPGTLRGRALGTDGVEVAPCGDGLRIGHDVSPRAGGGEATR